MTGSTELPRVPTRPAPGGLGIAQGETLTTPANQQARAGVPPPLVQRGEAVPLLGSEEGHICGKLHHR